MQIAIININAGTVRLDEYPDHWDSETIEAFFHYDEKEENYITAKEIIIEDLR